MTLDGAAGGGSPAAPRPEVDPDVVELVVIAVPDLTRVTHVAQALASLVARDQVRVLDLVAVVTTMDGAHTSIEPEAVAGLSILRDVPGEIGGFLSDDDIALASAALPPGTTALVLVVEDRWAQVLAGAARASGGRLVGGERIARQRVEEALAAVRGPEEGQL